MKITRSLTRSLATWIVISSISPWILAQTKENLVVKTYFGTEGKGAGTLDINNQIYTIGGAEIRFSPTPLSVAEIPALQMAIDMINHLPLRPADRAQILFALVPSEYREYYKVSEISKPDYQASLNNASQEYRETLNRDFKDTLANMKIEIAILHKKSISILMPEYFQIQDPRSQAALLIHEAFRFIQDSEYRHGLPLHKNIADLELSALIKLQVQFDYAFRNRKRLSLAKELSYFLNDHYLPLRLALQIDAGLPKIKALYDGQNFNLRALLDGNGPGPISTCEKLGALQKLHPQSETVRLLMPLCGNPFDYQEHALVWIKSPKIVVNIRALDAFDRVGFHIRTVLNPRSTR